MKWFVEIGGKKYEGKEGRIGKKMKEKKKKKLREENWGDKILKGKNEIGVF